jgi:hypothetical protein
VKKRKPIIQILSTVLLALALLFTILVFRIGQYKIVSKESIGEQMKILALGLWLVIPVLQFKALQRLWVYLSWLTIGIVLCGMHIWFRKDSQLSYEDEYGIVRHYSACLIIPLITLIYFQICRQISLWIHEQELGKISFNTVYNYEEGRRATVIEFFFVLGTYLIPVLTFYISYYS